jgi:hypothetical protein
MDNDNINFFMNTLPDDRKDAFTKLHNTIMTNLPKGFEALASKDMLKYIVPLSRYPKGYHATKGGPLPFISLASQKNHIALYHMGLYGSPELLKWFEEAYEQEGTTKLDMGKSCIRFKHLNQIPFDLIGTLCQKISVDDYIAQYEAVFNR